ncbi:TPA: transposase [Escherichia coli]|nr:transposase [Escherichia coli]
MIVLILVFRLVIGEQMIDVLGPEKRRRRTTQEKIAIVQQSFEPGMTVSLVARQHGVAASQLFLWRKQYQEGSLTAVAAGEQVVPASELAAARTVQSLTQAPVILLTHPRMGEQLFQFEPREVRRIFAGEYEIRYELNGQTIYVLRLWHTRENR